MTNSELLRQKISENGYMLKFIAKELGVTPYGLQLKIENQSEFKASEIKTIKQLLRLTNSEMNKIFFANQVD